MESWVSPVIAPAPVAGKTPLIWALQAEKAGDNAQIDTLLDAIGLPVTVKRLRMRARWQLGKPRIRPGLGHLDRAASDVLEPPWPDLVVLSGRRLINVALWLREQSPGHTRLVLVGRPHGLYEPFDLIVAAPQFRLPARANVINLDLPLMMPSPTAIAAAVERWGDEMSGLARPLTAVLVGGPTQPFRFDAGVAQTLLARTLAATGGAGTLYLSTSRRTPEAVAHALADALPPGARLFRWTAGAADNPYLALLGLADGFVVTGDSASMLVEVARLGRPLAVFELPVAPTGCSRVTRVLSLVGRRRHAGNPGKPRRDITELHRTLYRLGLAVPLGEPFPAGLSPARADSQLAQIGARVRSLLGLPAADSPGAGADRAPHT